MFAKVHLLLNTQALHIYSKQADCNNICIVNAHIVFDSLTFNFAICAVDLVTCMLYGSSDAPPAHQCLPESRCMRRRRPLGWYVKLLKARAFDRGGTVNLHLCPLYCTCSLLVIRWVRSRTKSSMYAGRELSGPHLQLQTCRAHVHSWLPRGGLCKNKIQC